MGCRTECVYIHLADLLSRGRDTASIDIFAPRGRVFSYIIFEQLDSWPERLYSRTAAPSIVTTKIFNWEKKIKKYIKHI